MKNALFKKKSGLTLIEMIMAIAIFAIGIEGTTLLFSKVWRNNTYIIESGKSSMAASQGLNRIVNYIRGARQGDNGAYAIKSADDNDLVVFSDYDKDGITERLHFYKNNQDIILGVTDPTGAFPKTYPSGDQTTITLVSNIANDDATPIFYYYDKNYPEDTDNNPMDTPVSSHLLDARLVKIYLKINVNSNLTQKDIEMQSFVKIRNLND